MQIGVPVVAAAAWLWWNMPPDKAKVQAARPVSSMLPTVWAQSRAQAVHYERYGQNSTNLNAPNPITRGMRVHPANKFQGVGPREWEMAAKAQNDRTGSQDGVLPDVYRRDRPQVRVVV